MEKLVSIFAYAPRAVLVGILVSAISLLIFLALAVALHRPPSIAPPTTKQQSQGANSPSIVGNNNTVTYGAAASERRFPTLTLRQHFSRGTPEGITEIFIFTNDGERATGVLDIRVLDDELTQVISYRGPLDTITPHLGLIRFRGQFD